MKEYIRSIIATAPDKWRARNLVREYLQARILQFLQEKGAFRSWVFHGGTALRFLFQLPRYSEDLDFTLKEVRTDPDLADAIGHVARAFAAEAYSITTSLSGRGQVKNAFIRFPGLPFELGLTPHRNESLSVRIEIDTNPPAGGKTVTTLLRRHVILNLLHHDGATHLAGKLHAVLMRPYVKGRDLYDLFWYLSDPSWPGPNIDFLNAALVQTHWSGPAASSANWRQLMARRIRGIDWGRALADVRPFIERNEDLKLLTEKNLMRLLRVWK